jgi:predicted AAA+ superfamily ATPase
MEIKEKIKFILKETNSWWKNENFKLENYCKRDIFSQVEKFFKLPQIIAFTGLRRTGKTTLILKVIEIYLGQIPAKNILYFSFDDFSVLEIEDILSIYTEVFPDISFKEGRFLFCFDEIQKLDDWQDKIKRLYDIYPNIKLFISGSESLFIRKKAKETLGGRLFEFKVSALSFKEYLEFTNNDRFIKNMELYKEDIFKAYRHFLKINGFPELTHIDDNMVIHKYLRETIIDKILFKDIPRLFKVKNVDVLSEILDLIVFYPGQIIDITKLSKEIGLSRQSTSFYLDYLEKSFLIRKVYNFSRNLRKQKRALKKYYPAIVFPELVEEKFSFCFENSFIWQLDAQFFYRDVYQNEVDIVSVTGKNKAIIPIEIKSGDIDLKGLNYFLKKYKLRNAIVLTLNRAAIQGNIKIIPFYKYLLR